MYSSAFMQTVRCGKLAVAFTNSSVGKRSFICVKQKGALLFMRLKNKDCHGFKIW